MANPETVLPPGFRFHPTDEELIQHYLKNQATSLPCPVSIIAEVDIYKFDPWDLPEKAMFGDKEWYFFSPRDRKYPNGVRPNRAAASGYWKATGTDKPILAGSANKENIGVKKALVFYTGKPPKGVKTDWIMHEYRLVENQKHGFKRARDSSMRLDDWVLCRIYKKSNNQPGSPLERESEASTVEKDVHLRKNASLGDLFNDADFSVLARLLHENPSGLDQPYDGGGIFSLLSPESPAAKRQSTPPEFDRYDGEPTSYPLLPHHLFDSHMGLQ